nr:MAG TPA: hypothetical protein [Caudoviricetes sp.]
MKRKEETKMKVLFEKLNARQKRLVIAYIRALLGGRT